MRACDPWGAVVFSSLFPGLGHLYTRRTALAVPVISITFVLLASAFALVLVPGGSMRAALVLVAAALVGSLVALPLAYLDARDRNRGLGETGRPTGKSAWLAVGLSRLLPGLGHLYLGRWAVGLGLLAALFVGSMILGAFDTTALWPDVAAAALAATAMYLAYTAARAPGSESPRTIHAAVLVAFWLGSLPTMIKLTVVRAYRTPAESMLPTLEPGDRFFVRIQSRPAPRRGDLVIIDVPNHPGTQFAKRVVGIPGDRVAMENKALMVNGRHVDDRNVIHGDPVCRPAEVDSRDNFGPILLGPDEYFVLGDNRDNSNDSRFFGPVHRSLIRGVVIKRYWPWSRAGRVE